MSHFLHHRFYIKDKYFEIVINWVSNGTQRMKCCQILMIMNLQVCLGYGDPYQKNRGLA